MPRIDGLLMATGFQGNLHELGVARFEDYERYDEDPTHAHKTLSHNITWGNNDSLHWICASREELTRKVASLYRECVAEQIVIPKPFGEHLKVIPLERIITAHQSPWARWIARLISALLSIFSSKKEIYIVAIAEKSYRKPAIATDAVHILKGKDSEGSYIFQLVGIIRSAEPGRGRGAAVGGFNNVEPIYENGPHIVDSAIATVLKESEEEISAHLRVSPEEIFYLKTAYNIQQYSTEILLGGERYPVTIVDAGQFKTSDELLSRGGETIPHGRGEKRVHLARSVLVYVDLGDKNIGDPEELKHFYRADSDAAAITISDVTDLVENSITFDEGIRRGRRFREENHWGIIHHGDIVGSACYALNKLVAEDFFMI